jgi:hypothetical protein
MNYKVMQRPMFKMGGKAASQGTGITSGLDEKVNMAIGGGVIKGDDLGAREGFQQPDLSSMSIEDLINLRQQNYNKQMSGLSDMRDIVRLQTLGNLATNVLPNIERGGLSGVVDFFQDPTTTQQAISGLTGLKKVDLKEKELKAAGLDRLIGSKVDLEKLKIARLKGTTTKTKMNYEATSQALEKTNLSEAQKQDILLGVISGGSYQTVQKRSADLRKSLNKQIENGLLTRKQAEDIISNFEATALGIFTEKEQDAEGGRVGRAMGSGDEGELPADPTEPVNPFKPKPIKPLGDGKMAFDDTPGFELKSLDALINEFEADNGKKPVSIDDLKRYFLNKYGPGFISKINQAVANESKDVAMETKGQGNNVYDMLRTRLPQEISDEVVKLIAYNKEAFGDFASIKNQEDVTSFNEKYGVELVIDVATV